jgi:hypothetical protein
MSTETTTPTQQAAQSGILRFDNSVIACTSQHYSSFSLPLAEVAVIGEFTTDNGPVIDDWFLVFVRRDGSEWFEASMYAGGIESLREQLSAALGSSIIGSLAASTDFASRIIWPVALAGRPLFTFSPSQLPASFIASSSPCDGRFRTAFLQMLFRRSNEAVNQAHGR